MRYVYHGSNCKGPTSHRPSTDRWSDRPRPRGGRAMAYFRTNTARSLVCLGISADILASGRAGGQTRTWVATKSNKRLINSLACSYTDIPLPPSQWRKHLLALPPSRWMAPRPFNPGICCTRTELLPVPMTTSNLPSPSPNSSVSELIELRTIAFFLQKHKDGWTII